jgi:Tfp pilus assembly protein PilF
MARNRVSKLCVTALLGACLQLAAVGCAGTSRPQEEAEANSKRARSHFDIAADHQENGRSELALRELLKAERLAPGNPLIHHSLGIAYLRKGKQAEAEHHLKRALEIRPDYQEARYNLSTLYMNQGRHDECIAESKRLYDDPTFTAPWRALTNWGWAVHQKGNVEEARRLLSHSLDYNEAYWPTLLNLGILEAGQDNKAEAIRYYQQALDLDPGASATAELSYRMAEVYVSMGKRREAVANLRTAVVRAPSDPWGKKSEAYLKLLH